jgi:pimeloyl-ACP methyl ester carboxylesterase
MDNFERSGLRFDVIDQAGAPDHGGPAEETVVLLHGFPQQPSAFDAVVPHLHREGLRTLVPSQRGYTSAARPRARSDYSNAETVADVVALLDAAGVDKAHLVGHDWGGFQVWGMAAWHPDRVASITVLSTPHPAAFLESVITSGQALRSWYMAFFQLPLLPETFARRSLERSLTDSRLPTASVAEYCKAMERPGALTGALNWYRGMPFSIQQRVGPITVPTTYVWGRHDFALGRAAAERTERHVQAPYQFRELNSGHWLPETEPDAVAEAILARVAG